MIQHYLDVEVQFVCDGTSDSLSFDLRDVPVRLQSSGDLVGSDFFNTRVPVGITNVSGIGAGPTGTLQGREVTLASSAPIGTAGQEITGKFTLLF